MCGSGKTEIVMKVISECINSGKKVGFGVPRRDVVQEIGLRFKKVFAENKIVTLYGGHTSDLYGDLICLTTHQLFRFNSYFDLLIMDEVDAYPFKGNDLLESLCERSLKGKLIIMSATLTKDDATKIFKRNFDILELFVRYHRHPLPVPKIIKSNKVTLFLLLIRLIKKYIKNEKQVFIFTPTIEICEKTYGFLKLFIRRGDCVHSKKEKRNTVISDFRNHKINYLVTTAVLERGVTVKDVQVIILFANHEIYDEGSLIQISGRVGRKADAANGDVIYLCSEITKDMISSIENIKKSNEFLYKTRREKRNETL